MHRAHIQTNEQVQTIQVHMQMQNCCLVCRKTGSSVQCIHTVHTHTHGCMVLFYVVKQQQ